MEASAASSSSDISITKGMCFPDQKSTTKALRKYAAANGMTIKLASAHHGGSMVRYKCDGGDECRFEVVALRSKSQSQSGYFISRCNLKHNRCVGRSKLTASQVRDDELIRSAVESDPSISGRLIVENVKRLRGAEINLSEAYRAKNLILDDLYGSLEDGFQKLESLVDVWKAKNPTSLGECDFNAQGEFVRAFISHPYASFYNTWGQKVAGVDMAVFRHGKYQSGHLVLVGKDGSNENIVLAIAVCATESETDCDWFLQCCIRAGVDVTGMPLFCDRGSAILTALEKIGVTTIRYCTDHIYQNVQDKFRCPPNVKAMLYRMQAAKTEFEYEEELKRLTTHPDIEAYIRSIEPEHWVFYTALRSSRLYGWQTTNFVKPEKSTEIESRRMLPFPVLQDYMEKIMQEAYTRRETLARRWLDDGHDLTEYARGILDAETASAAFCTVIPSKGGAVFVHDTRNLPVHNRLVDIEARTCTCTVFDQYGIPCKHFIAALNFLNRPAERFSVVDACYTINAYAALYGSGVASGIELALPEELSSNVGHHSPKSTKSSQKKERRQPSKGDTATNVGKRKRTCMCANCGLPGHNRRSCPSK